jgi:hypothetical protein
MGINNNTDRLVRANLRSMGVPLLAIILLSRMASAVPTDGASLRIGQRRGIPRGMRIPQVPMRVPHAGDLGMPVVL